MAMNIKKGDTVVVLSGKDKGKQGKVLERHPQAPARSSWRGINMVTCHVKPRKQGEQGGIVQDGSRHLCLQGAASSAPSATSPPASPTRCWRTARRSACASTAAPSFERGGVIMADKMCTDLKEQYQAEVAPALMQEVRLQVRHADPQDRQGRRQRAAAARPGTTPRSSRPSCAT